MSNSYPTHNDPFVTPPSPLKVSRSDTAPNHTPIAIIGGVAFVATIFFWAYHFTSTAACNPTSPVAHNIFIPSTTGSAR